MNSVYMGSMPTSWMSSKKIKTITFNVTDECNLRCKYCYFIHKDTGNQMSLDVAKKAVDYILTEPSFNIYDGVIWEFIGGEPTLEADLIDHICDYILESMYDKKHKWLYCYKFMIGTNGLLYSSRPVQDLIKKHKINIQVPITIDGSKEKHDMSRVTKDGRGSYDMVVKEIPLWLKQQQSFTTKATFAHDDLPYLKDSIINLWNLGLINISANIVFEDCWQEGDPEIFEQQLKELADYVIEKNLWNSVSVRFFDPDIGHPLSSDTERRNHCGTGKMLAISTTGKFYPCVRFLKSAQQEKEGLCIGSIYEGIDPDKVRVFYAMDTISQSQQKCLDCEVASGCVWCSGNNYCYAQTDTVLERVTYHCEMHKANVRAAEYFWNKYEQATSLPSPMRQKRITNVSNHQIYLYIILDENQTEFCEYSIARKNDRQMNSQMIDKAIKMCERNHWVPIFVGENASKYQQFGLTISSQKTGSILGTTVYTLDSIKENSKLSEPSLVLRLSKTDINNLPQILQSVIEKAVNGVNVNIVFDNTRNFTQFDLDMYEKSLSEVCDLLFSCWKNGNLVNLNLITHELYKEFKGACGAGIKKFALGLDGNFYLCPAFYFDEKIRDKYVLGNIEEGFNNVYKEICNTNKNTGCRHCTTQHCNRCVYLNKTTTGEFAVPPEIACIKAGIERKASQKFYNMIKKINITQHIVFNSRVCDSFSMDPIKDNSEFISNKYGY